MFGLWSGGSRQLGQLWHRMFLTEAKWLKLRIECVWTNYSLISEKWYSVTDVVPGQTQDSLVPSTLRLHEGQAECRGLPSWSHVFGESTQVFDVSWQFLSWLHFIQHLRVPRFVRLCSLFQSSPGVPPVHFGEDFRKQLIQAGRLKAQLWFSGDGSWIENRGGDTHFCHLLPRVSSWGVDNCRTDREIRIQQLARHWLS